MELKHILPFMVLLLCACQREQWDDCITSTGPDSEEVRTPGVFTTVDLDDRIDLVLEEVESGTVTVEAGENLIDQVSTNLRDGVLEIRNENKCNWVRSFKPRITVKVPLADVAKLVLRGTGNVRCTDTIVRDVFLLDQWGAQGTTELTLDVGRVDIGLHTGAGDVVLHGRCREQANLYNGIMGPIDAADMRARFVSVNNSGITDIRCWADNGLNAQIYDVGDVYYRGDPPTLQSQITGSGELIKVD
ncbi:MAG: DUF2807 domain-containing protein [Flavobacteriales bacterium]|nr:DUF2807 domain-containing protein [Flavobacteriales bacterium]